MSGATDGPGRAPVRSFADVPGLHLVDLDQRLVGQRRFISCWVHIAPDLAYVVDPGPPATGAQLVATLDDLGAGRLDFILLTHIHLDHGGATADVLARWPRARVVCHRGARGHLVAPERLWEGSLAVLQEKARVYGQPRPVPENALDDGAAAAAQGIRVVETPGHAPHHICFLHDGGLFVGEAAGTFSTLGAGTDTPEPYLRPATPPTFRPEVAQASLDRLLNLQPAPERLLFAHHGLYDGDVRGILAAAREQLSLWVETCRFVAAARGGLPAAAGGADEIALMEAIMAELALCDPYYARGTALPPDIRERERDFTLQTLRGMLGHLRDPV